MKQEKHRIIRVYLSTSDTSDFNGACAIEISGQTVNAANHSRVNQGLRRYNLTSDWAMPSV